MILTREGVLREVAPGLDAESSIQLVNNRLLSY